MKKIKILFFILLFTSACAQKSQHSPVNPFLKGGVPATDRAWTGVDYKITYELILSKKVPLPRLNDPNGYNVLKRITDVSYFEVLKNKNINLNMRMQDFLTTFQSVNFILKFYISDPQKVETHRPELAIIMSYMIRISAVGVDLINEFLPTIPRDKKYSYRMQGLKKMYSGLTRMFVGAEMSLNETYSKKDLSLILLAMRDSLPTLKNTFSDDYKTELKIKLKKHLLKFTGKDAKMLRTMINFL